MRLWHQNIIKELPRQQLLGQHREACALRGLGWYKNHSTVDYIFRYGRGRLFQYHTLIMDEMNRRGYNVDPAWRNPKYCGKIMGTKRIKVTTAVTGSNLYPEHNNSYMMECIENLAQKGITIGGKSESD